MKKGDKFYKIEALVSKLDIDTKLKHLKLELQSKSSLVFNALENSGIKVYDVSVHSASARIRPKQITLDISANGETTRRNGFKRFELEENQKQGEEDDEEN